MSQEQRAKAWRRVIGATRRKVNLGWWLEMLGPLCIGYAVIVGSALLYLRTQPWFEEYQTTAFISAGAGMVLLPLLAWLFGNGRFINAKEAAVRLESEMKLDNVLSSAELGMTKWPSPPMKPHFRDGLEWNWGRLVLPPFIAVILVAAAFLAPVQPIEAKSNIPQGPPAWEDMEDWLEELKEEEVANEEQLEELLEQLQELRDQPREEWFSHNSLEATDTLREALQRSINEMGENMEQAERSMTAMEKFGQQLGDAAREQLLQEYQDALQGMEFGNLQPTPEMMEAMKEMDLENLQKMSAAEREQLRKALAENAKKLKECMD